jgi:hypothetical protein
VHEEGEVERRRGEVPREEQRVHALAHLLDLGEACRRVLGQRLLQDVADRLRESVVVRRRVEQLGVGDPLGDVDLAAALEEGLSGEHLEEERAHREEVRARVPHASRGLLGREVLHLLVREAARLPHAGRPVAEAARAHFALVRNDHVRGRDHAVEVAGAALRLARVRVFERGADLAHDEQRVIHREREALLLATVEDGLQAFALDELVRDVEGRVHLPDAEQLDDVGF